MGGQVEALAGVAEPGPKVGKGPRYAPPPRSALYEINTRVLLTEQARRLGRPATLDDLPDALFDGVRAQGFDWVWLLGVWQTGDAGRRASQSRPEWREEFRKALPDLREEDIGGSPFAVKAYRVHTVLGGEESLARTRERLARRGLRLMLDFVPNHTALDHPWASLHPEYYIHGSGREREQRPADYCLILSSDGTTHLLAHGRDPYFPGWADTLQLNYRHGGLRQAMEGELREIAQRCDGLRCDMAMLLLPDVIERTWGESSVPADGSTPVDALFWPEAIDAVRREHPGFFFLAEVYWDREGELLQQGFDVAYDKRLYDWLRSGSPLRVRTHLEAPMSFQDRSARFLENHDEPRAAAAWTWPAHGAAAVVTYLAPGLRFFHEGQLEGRRVHVSPHLTRRPDEASDPQLEGFYRRLLACVRRTRTCSSFRANEILPAWPGNGSSEAFIAFSWDGESEGSLLVAVNYAPTRGQCFVALSPRGLSGRRVTFVDLMSESRYERDGDDLVRRGLYLDLPPWGVHVFEVK